MPGFLRFLGTLIILLGLATAAIATWQLAGDQNFREVATAYARHPEHALFQTEYWTAAAKHYGLLATAVGGLLGGLSLGSILLALGELLRRTRRV
jgi:hypothetical protein